MQNENPSGVFRYFYFVGYPKAGNPHNLPTGLYHGDVVFGRAGYFFVDQKIADLLMLAHTQGYKPIALSPSAPKKGKPNLIQVHHRHRWVRWHVTVQFTDFQGKRLASEMRRASPLLDLGVIILFTGWNPDNEFATSYGNLVAGRQEHRTRLTALGHVAALIEVESQVFQELP